MSQWLIGYDITDPKRLQRVHRALLRYAAPIEYSIFLLDGNSLLKEHCMQDIAKLIDPSQDDLRCYPLPSQGLRERLGKAVLPHGIYWSGLPSQF